MKRAILFLFVCVLAGCQPSSTRPSEDAERAAQYGFPTRPDGPIADAAQIIAPAEEVALDRRLRQLLDTKKTAVIVVTVTSLNGADEAAYANALARHWHIGAERGGLLILVAPDDRRVRIETDDAVRIRLTDADCAAIIEEIMLPRFRRKDYAEGIRAGVEAIAAKL